MNITRFITFCLVVNSALFSRTILAAESCSTLLISQSDEQAILRDLASLYLEATNSMGATLNSDPALRAERARQYRIKLSEAKKAGLDVNQLSGIINELKLEWTNKSQDEDRREREAIAVEESRIFVGSRIIFHSIEPGKFEMGKVGSTVPTEITKPFEMAATQTTQVVWKTVVELAKMKFPGQYESLRSEPSHFIGELNPVEQVSYQDIELWLKAYNALTDSGNVTAQNLMPGYRPGSHVRLPTEAEWEFVAKARGIAKGHYHFGDDEAELMRHAWYEKNAVHTTHPVAQKVPLIINGSAFYDLHGNVWEWVQDRFDEKLKGGKDPKGPNEGTERVLRGGAWFSGAEVLRYGIRNDWRPDDRSFCLGFRLVRTNP